MPEGKQEVEESGLKSPIQPPKTLFTWHQKRKKQQKHK
jgi:hypothetical protein